MSLSNPSQVLLRNSDLLAAQQPLIINCPGDNLVNDYAQLYPQAKLTLLNTNFADYQALQNKQSNNVDCHFTSHYQTKTQHDLVIIYFPKSKQELHYTLAMISGYLAPDTQILLVGDNKGGVKSSPKLTSEILTYCEKIDSARHCSLFSGQFNNIVIEFKQEAWFKNYHINVEGIDLTIASLPGVFSQSALDIGTKLLLQQLPKQMSGKVLDFGCGAGVISCFIGKKHPQSQLALLDVSALAIASAKQTLIINGLSGQVFPSNGISQVTDSYQHIVSNPPFHQGIKTHYQITENFLSDIKNHMKKSADITIVANSFLRYQPIMQQHIGTTHTQINQQGFSIYYCQC